MMQCGHWVSSRNMLHASSSTLCKHGAHLLNAALLALGVHQAKPVS
jgi:hypothetical protein